MAKRNFLTVGAATGQPSFLVQRLHPNLRVGLVPSIEHNKRLMPIFVQQDFWSSACGAHCVAMAMALLGDIKNVERLSERSNGAAGRLWKAAQAMYFDGATPLELAKMIDAMKTGRSVAVCTGRHAECLDVILNQLARGKTVIASWHSRRGKRHHWIVIVGVEGLQAGQSFTPTTLLGLDPGLDEPVLAPANSRIEFTSYPVARSSRYVRYRCSDGSNLAVTLTSTLTVS